MSAQQSPLFDPNAKIDTLVQALYREPWRGADNICIPVCWNFHFTAPMRALLNIGQEAQPRLLLMLPDVAIRDQVIILLGGVGDDGSIVAELGQAEWRQGQGTPLSESRASVQ